MNVMRGLRAGALVLALAAAGLVGTTAPAVAAAGETTAPSGVVALGTVVGPSSSVSAALAPQCQVYGFGPSLGSAGVYVEFDVVCNFATTFSLNGQLRAGTTTVALRGTTCQNSTFCVLVVQSPGCLNGFLYSGRLDGAIQFPGEVITFTRLLPFDGSGVRVC